MVWLNLEEENGNALYLDIYSEENRNDRGVEIRALSATLGDGLFEGQVLIEVGTDVEVTFADRWLNPQALKELFDRVDREKIERSLKETFLVSEAAG